MTAHEKVFFNILRSALWKTPVEVPEGFSQWGSVMKLAKAQALMGLVGDVLLTTREIRDGLSPKFVERLQDIPLNSMGMHTQMNLTLQLLVMTLRKEGIEPVLLKGQGLSKYYPVPELRQCGDIDLYVGMDNYEKAYESILPIASDIDDRSEIWDSKHFHASIGPVMVEVHHTAATMGSRRKNQQFRMYMLDGLSKDLSPVDFKDVQVLTPNATFNAFYVFYHLWGHFSSAGVGLRQFCDWACFLHTHVGKLDLPYLKEMIETLGFMKPWQVFGCFLVKELGLPEDEFPFYNPKYTGKVDKVREYVMADGNFGINSGYVRAHKYGYIREKMISLKFHFLRFFKMFSIFPKHTLLRFFYMLREGFDVVFKDIRKKK